jgi:hypothetical protein
METNGHITITKSLLLQIVRAAQQESRRIRGVHIIPQVTASGGDDVFVFDCDREIRDAASDG